MSGCITGPESYKMEQFAVATKKKVDLTCCYNGWPQSDSWRGRFLSIIVPECTNDRLQYQLHKCSSIYATTFMQQVAT